MFKSALAACVVAFCVVGSAMAAAPLPEVAKGLPIPADKGYVVKEIADHIYFVTEGAYTTMFLTTGNGVIMVDAPPSIGANLLKAVADVTTEPIKYVIYSHAHADHIGAAGLYPKGVTIIAHAATKALLAADPARPGPCGVMVGGGPVPLPTVTFTNSYRLTVGNQTLELAYRGDDHEPGNIYIYAPKQKVLMKVDIIFPGWAPFMSLAVSENVRGFLKAQDVILSYDFATLVSGHFGRPATRQDVETQKAYLQDIVANATTALKTVDFNAIASKTGYENLALLFDTYLKAVEQKCTDLTVPKWVDKLGGVDVWTPSHCARVIETLRID